MTTAATNTLAVPGASLYYEVRGAGPALLLIPGGNGDAGPYQWLADELAQQYSVISYDRRGFARSPLAAPPDDDLRLATDTDDVVRLLDHLADGPAVVFGSSSGAIVALDVITKHPEHVRTLVAHEPPLARLLDDGQKWLDSLDAVYDTYRRDGFMPAIRPFNALVGMDEPEEPPPEVELPPAIAAMMSRMRPNLEFWLEHELRQYIRYEPDIAALQAVSSQIVLAGGRDSREFFPYRPNLVLAERLGLDVVDFPGDHIGYGRHAREFAARLTEVLAARP